MTRSDKIWLVVYLVGAGITIATIGTFTLVAVAVARAFYG